MLSVRFIYGMLVMLSINIASGHPVIPSSGFDSLLPTSHYDRRAAASSGSSTGLGDIANQTRALTAQQVSLLTGKKVGLLDLQDIWTAMGVDKITDPLCVAGLATFKTGSKPTQQQADACSATHTAGDNEEKVIINGLRDKLNSGAAQLDLFNGMKALHSNQSRKLCAQATAEALNSMIANSDLAAAESAFKGNGEAEKCSKQTNALNDDQTKGIADPKAVAIGTVNKAIQVNIIGANPPLTAN